MTLTTHAVAGAAVALAFRAHPALGILAAFASHFPLDAIPHWDHPLYSHKRNSEDPMDDRLTFWTKEFYRDVLAAGFDGMLGLALIGAFASWYTPHHLLLALAGGMAGILPDVLQVVYYAFPHSPIRHLQRFHRWVHAKSNLNHNPTLGIPIQLVIMLICAGSAGIL